MVALLTPSTRPFPAAKNSQTTDTSSFFIRTQNVLERVAIKDIRYIHADGNYCYLFTSRKKYAIKLSLTRLMEKLPHDEFLRIHKSYIVQMNDILKVDLGGNLLVLQEASIPIGRAYRTRLLEALEVL
ncbi:MAG: LytTR family DNA-binding domain-containing protein [Saprospiraceae bacterium]